MASAGVGAQGGVLLVGGEAGAGEPSADELGADELGESLGGDAATRSCPGSAVSGQIFGGDPILGCDQGRESGPTGTKEPVSQNHKRPCARHFAPDLAQKLRRIG